MIEDIEVVGAAFADALAETGRAMEEASPAASPAPRTEQQPEASPSPVKVRS